MAKPYEKPESHGELKMQDSKKIVKYIAHA